MVDMYLFIKLTFCIWSRWDFRICIFLLLVVILIIIFNVLWCSWWPGRCFSSGFYRCCRCYLYTFISNGIIFFISIVIFRYCSWLLFTFFVLIIIDIYSCTNTQLSNACKIRNIQKHSFEKKTYHRVRLLLKYKEKYQLIIELFQIREKPTHATIANRPSEKKTQSGLSFFEDWSCTNHSIWNQDNIIGTYCCYL
jgi:hypothetical protein